jgi:hypothetical protein
MFRSEHRTIKADKVLGVGTGPDRRDNYWILACGARVEYTKHLWEAVQVSRKATPVDGYYVRFPDGTESWMPAHFFEEHYSPIEPIGQ